MQRHLNRSHNEIRETSIVRGFTRNAAGSTLIRAGNTHVLCTASIDNRVPFHLRGKNQGWVTGEYSLLPGSTKIRSAREASRGRQGGRTMEIQRLLGRSLRACIDLSKLGERTIIVDCDVLQADGGTRCASITGGYVALVDAVNHLLADNAIKENPMTSQAAAISAGIVDGQILLDLDYSEDSSAQTDMNFVMNSEGRIIEAQGTAEREAFTLEQMVEMAALGKAGIEKLIEIQRHSLAQDLT